MIVLYSRRDCPLCEDVEDTLVSLGIAYQFVDIDLDEELRKKYHILVPVIKNTEHNAELRFPFTEEEIMQVINHHH